MNTLSPSTPKFPLSWLDFFRRPHPLKKFAWIRNGTIGQSVPQLVSAQADANPQAPALIVGDNVVSYHELEIRSNAVARHLEWLGVRPGTLVPLVMERSDALVAGALGIMKAGAAYLPLDPSYPVERLNFILNDAKSSFVLTSSDSRRAIPPGSWKSVSIETVRAFTGQSSSPASLPVISPSQLAYVIYTSGSTGRPKGVEITHANLGNLVHWHVNAFGVSASDRATLLASPGFDAAVWEIWPYLAAGASLHIVDDTTRASAKSLRNWLLSQRITISFVPTPVAQQLIFLEWPADTTLRCLLTGADVLQHYPPAGLPFAFVNNYGPTECAVVATSGIVSADHRPTARPSIGRPITNSQAYVLDENLKQLPAGSVGELYIAGANVGRGYFNDPKLTAQKFIPNPFNTDPESRIYKTGDLVRLRLNGELEFVGRTDDQVKIHGHRIEPEEVSTALCKHPAVDAGIVLARKNASGDPYLVAYLVWKPGNQANAGELRDHLRGYLPDYMVPNTFVAVSSFALTQNGKIDRAALPEPDASNTLRNISDIESKTNTEAKLSSIVSALLQIDSVNAQDNFFLLGGHSLLGAQLLAQIHNTFHLDLSLRTLFDHPTVAAIAAEIDRNLAARGEMQQT